MPVIDPMTFDELKQISGEDFINELIDAFLDDAPNMIKNMQSALDSKDVESFRRNAHSMKSRKHVRCNGGVVAEELEFMGKENNLDIGNQLRPSGGVC
jgi:hypothetical protein